MIQRKQSIWLLLAALLNAGVFYFCLYKYNQVDAAGAMATKYLQVLDHYPSLLIALVMVALPFINIFLFGNRKRQIRLTVVSILSIISFIALTLGRVTNLSKLVPPATDGSYRAGAILPVIAVVFLIMAIVGIRRDEKLVKSVDRLR